MDELKPPKKAEQGFTMDDVVDDLAAVMDENANVEVQRVDNETAFIKVPRTGVLLVFSLVGLSDEFLQSGRSFEAARQYGVKCLLHAPPHLSARDGIGDTSQNETPVGNTQALTRDQKLKIAELYGISYYELLNASREARIAILRSLQERKAMTNKKL